MVIFFVMVVLVGFDFGGELVGGTRGWVMVSQVFCLTFKSNWVRKIN